MNRRTGLTEDVTWHLRSTEDLRDFLYGLKFDKHGRLREGHIVHLERWWMSGTVRLNAGASGDDVHQRMAAAIPTLPIMAKGLLDHLPLSSASSSDPSPPRVGELIICVFVPTNRQEDRLADFGELFGTVWLPKFGVRLARWVYIAQALRSAAAVARIAAMAAVFDRVARVFGH